MTPCALCPGPARAGVGLTFDHVRRGQAVALEIDLCETCANRVEKHLKRIIPKRLMEITAEPAEAPTL
jgi:hypothetical protein